MRRQSRMLVPLLLCSVLFVGGGDARRLKDAPGREMQYTYKSVCIDGGKLSIVEGKECKQMVALGRWQNAVNATGWAYLEVETKSAYADTATQAYAAGYVEGVLSKQLLSYHIHNIVEPYCKNFTKYCDRLNGFLNENQAWVKSQLQDNTTKEDVYWQSVNNTYYQISGLIDGYEGKEPLPRIVYDLHAVHFLNMNGEFYDLERMLNKTIDPTEGQGHCSAIVKVAPGNKDLFISHVTMEKFQLNLRVLKLYKFAYDAETYPGRGSSFSSYPGLLYSGDDFLISTSGLAVIETTINVFNASLYEKTQAKGQLLAWVRHITANRLARSALEWCEIFARYNSGTFNNQWVILDYSKFKPNYPLPALDLLYVLEQLPGKVIYRDMTWFLQQHSYFPSYNIPYFSAITETAGYIQQSNKVGDWFRWGKTPRARMLERDHNSIVDMDSLTKLLRSNDYKNDPLSRCNCTPPYSAEAALSTRGDLNLRNGTYEFAGQGHLNHGSLDFKGTNLELAKQLRFRGWAGPTYGNVPPFRWSEFDFDVPHVGHPDLWDFIYVEHKWESPIGMKSF